MCLVLVVLAQEAKRERLARQEPVAAAVELER
jgi:hypothetical protein